jgi:hypothetical protein
MTVELDLIELKGFGDDATPEMKALMKAAYDTPEVGLGRLAKALTLPLQQGVLRGDILESIFEPIKFDPGVSIEFPIDFLNPGDDRDFVAYTMPSGGRVPERHVEGDFVMVPTFEVANSIDCNRKYLRDARWDVMDRMMAVLTNGFVRRMNDDGWHTLIAAALARGVTIYDSEATAGYFTKRLVSLLQTGFRRYGGGNSTSLNRSVLTDLYLSVESMMDIRNWDLTQVDDVTRRQIFVGAGDKGVLNTIYGVNIHDLDELGEGFEFNKYFTDTLGGPSAGVKRRSASASIFVTVIPS